MRLLVLLAALVPSLAVAQGVRFPTVSSRTVLYAPMSTSGCFASPYVSGGLSLTATRATAQVKADHTTSCGNNEVAVETTGAAIFKAATQLYPTPSAPAAGTVTHSVTGNHTFWVVGTGSQTLTASGTLTATGLPCTATEAGPCVYNVTATGATPTATLSAVTGSLTKAQVEASAYPTPFVASGTRNATNTSFTRPTNMRPDRWCISVDATVNNRAWYNAGALNMLWSFGALAGVNTMSLLVNSGNLIFSSYNSAGSAGTVTWAYYGTAEDKPVKTEACNFGGALALYVDGVSVGTVAGTIPSVLTALPATGYIGHQSTSIRHFDGMLSNFRICTPVGNRPCTARVQTGTPIAFLGDSITAGSAGQIAPYPYATMALLPSGWAMQNFGVAGYTTAQTRTVWTNTVRAQAFPHLSLMVGVNDIRVGTTAAAVWTDLKAIVDEAVADGDIVHLGTVTPFNNYSGGWTAGKQTELESLNTTIAAYCNGTTIKCFDANAAVRDPGTVSRLLPTFDIGDNIHPNHWGAKAIGAAAAATFP